MAQKCRFSQGFLVTGLAEGFLALTFAAAVLGFGNGMSAGAL
jgi:hypothetical protein